MQVATAWPEVDSYRRAYSRLLFLRDQAVGNGPTLLRTIDLYPGTSSAAVQIRERARARFMEFAVPLLTLERSIHELQAAAEAVAPAAAVRARLSINARLEALEAERVAEQERHDHRQAGR